MISRNFDFFNLIFHLTFKVAFFAEHFFLPSNNAPFETELFQGVKISVIS